MNSKPLADRMRPNSIEDYVGQKHILGEGKLLRRAIKADMLKSIILWGPPGTGKTSLAHVISKATDARFVQLNATNAKKSDVVDVIEMAKQMLIGQQRKTILFIDEIHRFNKGQQDALLPAVEDGTIILIGATTENPSFEVNGALLSRSTLFKLELLKEEDIKYALSRAVEKEFPSVEVLDEALNHIANVANGDLRTAYNAIELAILTTSPRGEKITIRLHDAEESIQRRVIRYDKGGSNHYDIMSAFSKSLRGGDSSAALHYFARMIEAGEDPKAIVRRLITHSAEDVGLANPQALVVCTSAMQALQVIGMPEARIPISQAIIYVCESPKSNAVMQAISQAFHDVQTKPAGEVPVHLRDSHYPGAKQLGHGEGYVFPHALPGNFTPNQQYLPDNLVGASYYKPTNNGFEAKVRAMRKERVEKYNKLTGGQ